MGRVGRMGRKDRKRLRNAEAEVRRIHKVLLKLEAQRDAASERLDHIADEAFVTPKEEAALSRRVEIADREVGRIEEQIAEAEGDFQRAQEDFDYLLGADDDDDHGDEDSGEKLNVHDAADIWMSSGTDEDYTSGYTEDELRRALEE